MKTATTIKPCPYCRARVAFGASRGATNGHGDNCPRLIVRGPTISERHGARRA